MSRRRAVRTAIAGLIILALAGGAVAWFEARRRPKTLLESVVQTTRDVAGSKNVEFGTREQGQVEVFAALPHETIMLLVADRRLELEKRPEFFALFNDRLAMTVPESREGRCLEQRLIQVTGVRYQEVAPLVPDEPEPTPPDYC